MGTTGWPNTGCVRPQRVAVWSDDFETQDLALNSLGNLFSQQGSFVDALNYLTRALSVARRHRIKDRQGAVTHDLFAVAVLTGDHSRAERLAAGAFQLYGPGHPNLPKLAHDVVQLWIRQGRFPLALPALRALLRFFDAPQDRLRVLASTARAAGACGERQVCERAWIDAWSIVHQPAPEIEAVMPAVLVDLGLGAASLGDWSHAAEAFSLALEAAQARGAHEEAANAEMGLEMVGRYERVEISRRAPGGPALQLAEAFVHSLEEAGVAAGQEPHPAALRSHVPEPKRLPLRVSVPPDVEVVPADPLSGAVTLVWWRAGAAAASSGSVGTAEQPASSRAATTRASFLVTSMCASRKIWAGDGGPTTKNALVFHGGQHMHGRKRWTFRTREMNEAIQPIHRVRDLLTQDSPALRGLLGIKEGYAARALRWDDLVAVAREAAPSAVLIVAPFNDPALAVPNPRMPELIVASAGMVPVLALVPFHSAFTAAVRTLLDQGVTEIADVKLEATPNAIRPRLQALHAQPLKRLVEPALPRFASANTRTLIRAAAEVAVDGGTAVDLAEVFRSNERTVSGWCAREALPPPRRLLAWLRLILALSLLESPHRSVARAARGAGYSFDHSLRRAVRDMLGGDAPPRERTVSQALDAFASELRSLREQRRQEKRAA